MSASPDSPGFGSDIGWRGDNNDLSSNPLTLSVSLVFCMFVAVIFELLTSYLETRWKKRNQVMNNIMLHRLFRQLALVGIMGVFLTLLGNSPFFPPTARKLGFAGNLTDRQMFRYVHYIHVIFAVLALAFIISSIFLTNMCQRARQLYDRYHGLNLDAAEERLSSFERAQATRNIFQRVLLDGSTAREFHTSFNFVRLRDTFLEQHAFADFDFSTYIEKNLQQLCIRLVTVPWYAWFIFVLLGIIQCVRSALVALGDTAATLMFMVVGFVLLLFLQLLSSKVDHAIEAAVFSLKGSEAQGLVDGSSNVSIRRYLWFGTPRSAETLVQVLIIAISMFFALFFMEFAERIKLNHPNVLLLCTGFIPIVLLLVWIPRTFAIIIPQLCLISAVDEKTNGPLIEATLHPEAVEEEDAFDVPDAPTSSEAGTGTGISILPALGTTLFNMPPPVEYTQLSTSEPTDSWNQATDAATPTPGASDAWDTATTQEFDHSLVDEGAELEGLFEYEASGETQISFPAGARLIAEGPIEQGWVLAAYNGNEGYVPASYVKCVRLAPKS